VPAGASGSGGPLMLAPFTDLRAVVRTAEPFYEIRSYTAAKPLLRPLRGWVTSPATSTKL
jgi:hypothetical protein